MHSDQAEATTGMPPQFWQYVTITSQLNQLSLASLLSH